MRRTGNEVTKEQKAELRLLEDNVVELRRRTALQVRSCLHSVAYGPWTPALRGL
jgi:hypothetical protein